MTRIQSVCFVLAVAVAPALSSCSAKTFAPTSPAIGTVELAKPKLTGSWKGSWDTLSYAGTFTMHLTQKGKKFSGTVAITLESVTTNGTIKGTIKRKGKLTLVVTAKGMGTGSGTAEVNKARTSMKGTVTLDGKKSTFSGSKT
jgi:hypothetical protein